MIPNDAVSFALDAFLADDDLHTMMRSALEAAAPYMLAEVKADALDEAARAIDADPYDDLDPFYAAWLRARAEKIREGE